MKAYDIALFIFLFNIAISFVNYAYSDILGQQLVADDTTYVQQVLNETGTTTGGLDRLLSSIPIVGDLYTSVKIVVSTIYQSITGGASMLKQMGMPATYADSIGAIMLLIYAIGIADFMRGSGGVEQ